ncbi:MAG: carotenoid biosynthesis protein [Bacteroidia bacterium]|nr:carotenoid biosynthesis protein [Bacteroidia bacterium]NNM15669.1 carotenoid biosynthesis protein [Bacteroidia bacterium]
MLQFKEIANHKHNISVFTVWLFHISALIGIALGFKEWFITKTPLNLIIIAVLLILNFPINSIKKVNIALLFIFLSMLVEWIGVHNDFLFGSYYYGENLGVKIFGVPLLIGLNWAVLTLTTAAIAQKLFRNSLIKIAAGSALMVFLDVFLEIAAPNIDFWYFENNIAPVRNYIAWFAIGLLLHFIYNKSKIKGEFVFSLHVYLVQLIFFIFLYGYYHL